MSKEIEFFQTHQKRLSIEFSKHLMLHRDLSFVLQNSQNSQKKEHIIRLVSIENSSENCFHAAIILSQPDEWLVSLLGDIPKQLDILRKSISVSTGNAILGNELRPISAAVFSQILYIYADQICPDLKNAVCKVAQNLKLQISWRDAAFWSRWTALQQGEVFLCHDSSDKPFVELLSSKLIGMGVSPWFDKISLEIGDSLIDKINEGLKNCKYAILVLSPSFLKNHAWPRREFKSLVHLSLQARKNSTNEKIMLPIWRGVTSKEVMEYDPELHDIFAAKASLTDQVMPEEIENIAKQIVKRIRA